MRREIIGILLIFLVIFTLISLLSYSPSDPSFNNAKAAGSICNWFGLIGSYLAGLLLGLFGLGSFWIPVLLFLSGFYFFSNYSNKSIMRIITGGILLVISTGSLLSLKQYHYCIFGSKFSSGGVLCIPLKSFLVKYSNSTGCFVILLVTWIVGFMLATDFSMIAFIKRGLKEVVSFADWMKKIFAKQKKQKGKSKTGSKEKSKPKIAAKEEIKIKTADFKVVKKANLSNQTPVHFTDQTTVPDKKVFDYRLNETGFQLPSVNFLDNPETRHSSVDYESLKTHSQLLEKKLEDFNVRGKVVAVTPGPVITTFEYEPAPGVKINKIVNLSDDLALALRALSIRIIAPIPGKSVIGIEIPNAVREMVRFKELIVSDAFEKSKSLLSLCLGKDIVGNPVVANLAKMPHLLIAGATGSGKSVALNAIICSLLYKSIPDEIKLIMVDPKRIEFSNYDGIPHLITPVVTDVKKATNALYWAVREMERRYELLSEKKAKNIGQYNQKIERAGIESKEDASDKLPFIVIIIDELADLMMVASRDVEVALTRLAQMARAAGIHLILATQRPSVDVLTGIIKANFPTRISFQVSSKTDSRTIIDTNGAETLLGNGDMLFLPPGVSRLQRIQGAYISETELTRIIDFLKEQKKPEYIEEIIEQPSDQGSPPDKEDYDEKYDEAVALVTKTRQASISMIQRHLRIGYNRAARIVEVMEKDGVVGPSDGVKPREVLVPGYD